MLQPDEASEMTELNMAYLLLAQKLLRQERAGGMLRLGVTPEVAEFVLGLSPSQILKMSSASTLLCGFRMGELVRAVLGTTHGGWLQRAHLFIVLAARHTAPREQPEEEITA
jgi:flagellar transcriptional activator FlhD